MRCENQGRSSSRSYKAYNKKVKPNAFFFKEMKLFWRKFSFEWGSYQDNIETSAIIVLYPYHHFPSWRSHVFARQGCVRLVFSSKLKPRTIEGQFNHWSGTPHSRNIPQSEIVFKVHFIVDTSPLLFRDSLFTNAFPDAWYFLPHHRMITGNQYKLLVVVPFFELSSDACIFFRRRPWQRYRKVVWKASGNPGCLSLSHHSAPRIGTLKNKKDT